MGAFEDADAISVVETIDEAHFEADQTSPAPPAKEENNNRSKEFEKQQKRSDQPNASSIRGKERKRSAPDGDGPERGPKIKVAGPWSRFDRRDEEKSGSMVTGVVISHRPSPSQKKPFVQPFIQKLHDFASNPYDYNNALRFTDRDSNRNGERVTVAQVFTNRNHFKLRLSRTMNILHLGCHQRKCMDWSIFR